MKRFCIVVVLMAAASMLAKPQSGGSPFAGRWDLTVKSSTATYPSWMEAVEKDGNLQVRVQEREGAVHPAAAVKVSGTTLTVTVLAASPARAADGKRPARPAQPAFTWELTAKGGKLSGVQKRGERQDGEITGVRAPELKRAAPKAWGNPEPLFNGKDLTGWETRNNTDNPKAAASHWTVKDGELVNTAQGQNIMTARKFDDFKLHVEFNLGPQANSGIYLRGRYECQMPPPGTVLGEANRGVANLGYAIYGMVHATADAPGKPDTWRSYDITLVGRYVTLVLDGVTIVNNQEIAGITGGALDSDEGGPGPIYFQGDHTGDIRYRNITISVPKR